MSVYMYSTQMFIAYRLKHIACSQVYPIEGFPDREICDASKGAINNHLLKYSAVSRILQQVSRNWASSVCYQMHRIMGKINK